MKKGIFFSLIFLAGFTVFSQDYQCIRDNATYFYSDGNNIKAIKIDSVVSTNEGLVYYNYPAMTPENGDKYCYSRFGPSWIGRKVCGMLIDASKRSSRVMERFLANTVNIGSALSAPISEKQRRSMTTCL